MKDYNSSAFSSDSAQQLARALSLMTNKKDVENFLSDVMTSAEISEISARFQAAKMLAEGVKYLDVQSKTGLSSATVARISDWLKNGRGGYKQALSLSTRHHQHA